MCIVLGILILALLAYIVYLYASYYRIEDNQELVVEAPVDDTTTGAAAVLATDTEYSAVTYNIGFGAYLPDYSFFMDGGTSSWAESPETVQYAINGAGELVKSLDPDFALIQEIDLDATRSYHTDEYEMLRSLLPEYTTVFAQNYDSARVAIDMALGRGGDQAVVKDGSRIQYYGGKSQQQEKSTRVKARVKAHAMRELMETKDRILIMGHKLSDSDAFGSAIGIYRIATALNKKAHVIINEVTTSVQPMMNRFLDNPDYPEDLFLTGAQAAELVDASTMLVVVDVNRPSITDAPELLKLVKTIVVMDHHRQSSEVISNAVLSYVEPYASSACEMVAEVLQYIADGIKIKAAEADAMYAGIVIDTNNFTNQTGVRTFEAAAFLRRNGADVTRVRKLFRDDMQDYKARAAAISSAEIYREAFSIGVCPSEGLPSPTIVCAQAANELLEIKGIKASVVMTEYHGLIYLSARSIDEVNVQVMMEKLGGGGHRTIAGAQLSGISMEEAKDRVKAVIDEMLQKGDIS